MSFGGGASSSSAARLFANRTARATTRAVGPIMVITAWDAVLAVRIGTDDARVRRKAFSPDQARVHARLHRRLKHMAQNVRLAKAAMPALGEGRMVRHPIVQIQTTEMG